MTEGIIIALVTAVAGLLGALLRTFMQFRNEDLGSHESLGAQIEAVDAKNDEAHRQSMERLGEIHTDLRTHRAVTEEHLANIDKNLDDVKRENDEREHNWQHHSRTLSDRLGRIEGKLE